MTGNVATQSKELTEETMYNRLTPNLRKSLGKAMMLNRPLEIPQAPKIMPIVKVLKPKPPRLSEVEYIRGRSIIMH